MNRRLILPHGSPVLLKAILPVFAIAVFFCSRPYTDLLPFPVNPGFVSGISPIFKAAFLFASVAIWVGDRCRKNVWLLAAKTFALIPFIIILSVPNIPEVLFEKEWTLTACILFLISPFPIVSTSSSLKSFGWGRRFLFVTLYWGVAIFFMVLLAFVMMRANPIPLSGALAMLILTSLALYHAAGGVLIRPLRFLAISAIILPVASGFGKTERQPLSDSVFKVEPYLQNAQKDSITVCWETWKPLPGKVVVGTNRSALNESGKASICESPSATLHQVEIRELTENSLYHYRVDTEGESSPAGTFRAAQSSTEPFEIVVYGDSQWMFDWAEHLVRNRHRDVCNSILRDSPEARFVVHVGDMTFFGNIHDNWRKQFFTPARDLMRNTVLWPTIGNHEMGASWYFDYFSLPNTDERYYAFDYGNCRFIMLAVEGYAVGHEYGPKTRTPMDEGSPQYEWLRKTLEQSQEKTWRFVFCHQSPYASGLEGGYTPSQKTFVPLFEQYKVTAVFSGHDHFFEYSEKDNVSYVITGGGGGAVSTLQPDLRHNPYSQFMKGVWHHCRVRVHPTEVTLEAVDLKGRVFYSSQILQQ